MLSWPRLCVYPNGASQLSSPAWILESSDTRTRNGRNRARAQPCCGTVSMKLCLPLPTAGRSCAFQVPVFQLCLHSYDPPLTLLIHFLSICLNWPLGFRCLHPENLKQQTEMPPLKANFSRYLLMEDSSPVPPSPRTHLWG